MMNVRQYIKEVFAESKMFEVSPPDERWKKWVKSNKQRFIDRYGEKEGLKVLYGKAWNLYNKNRKG